MLKESGAEKSWKSWEEYYDSDPQFGKGKSVTAPPVPWLLCVYGINVDTEVSFIASRKSQKGSNLSAASRTVTHDTFLCKGGILYETSDSVQKILENYPEESPW